MIRGSGGKKCVFLIKMEENGGIRAIVFKKRVKLGTMLIETMLSGDPL